MSSVNNPYNRKEVVRSDGSDLVSLKQSVGQEASAADAAELQKYLDKFDPSVVRWFKDNLDLDLASGQVSVRDLRHLLYEEFTSVPYPLVVRPLVYDAANKQRVMAAPVRQWAALRVFLPKKDGKAVPVSDENTVRIITAPCKPYVQLDKDGEYPMREAAPSVPSSVRLSSEVMMALEGIGLNRERFFGSVNRIKPEVLELIAAGKPFPVDGTVKTSFGIVNLSGTGRLYKNERGEVRASFDSNTEARPKTEQSRAAGRKKDAMSVEERLLKGLPVPMVRRSSKKSEKPEGPKYAPDILGMGWVGSVKLDYYRRYSDGSLVDDGDSPLTREARNIRDFGASLGPVPGEYHYSTYNSATQKMEHHVEPGYYFVRIVQGYPSLEKYRAVQKVDGNGRKVTAFELPSAVFRVKDMEVRDYDTNEVRTFRTEQDRDDFIMGYGGHVKDAVFKHGPGRDKVYDGLAYPMETGSASVLSPSSTKRIEEQRSGYDFRVDTSSMVKKMQQKKKGRGIV